MMTLTLAVTVAVIFVRARVPAALLADKESKEEEISAPLTAFVTVVTAAVSLITTPFVLTSST
jgi:hypothetical protein